MSKSKITTPAFQAYQGDVAIFSIDAAKYGPLMKRTFELKPHNGRLILAEGELTGHHHHIPMTGGDVMEREAPTVSEDESASLLKATLAAAKKRTSEAVGKLMTEANKTVGATFWRETDLITKLQQDGVILRTDLAVGILEVKGDAPVSLEHQEHDPILLPPGLYYIGGQVESAGAEERRVAD